MNNRGDDRASERGAISIKTLLVFTLAATAIFSIFKIAPVYTEQRQVIYDADELANKSAVRNLKMDDVKKAAETLRNKYSLPEGSINVVVAGDNKTQINVSYAKDIDLLLTKYNWKVQYTAIGKPF